MNIFNYLYIIQLYSVHYLFTCTLFSYKNYIRFFGSILAQKIKNSFQMWPFNFFCFTNLGLNGALFQICIANFYNIIKNYLYPIQKKTIRQVIYHPRLGFMKKTRTTASKAASRIFFALTKTFGLKMILLAWSKSILFRKASHLSIFKG